jgi:biofilm PGA synthesis N-glycosyltransferase PgaC
VPNNAATVQPTTESSQSLELVGARPLTCSVGIMAYNEEANIAIAIDAILRQQPATVQIKELIVVASGCTDATASIVAKIAESDRRIRLIVQERREGKASAINLFIAAARSPVLLMCGADVMVKEGTLERLLTHFRDPSVGMVGGHPIPVNDDRTFLGHAVHLLWRLHDRLARQSPKLGEIVAFRNVVPSIPLETAVDEISIEALVTQMAYRLVYEPEAIVYNHGPTTVRDFLRQRRRIYAGHLRVRKEQSYSATSMSVWRALRALLGSGSFRTPRAAWRTLCTVALEATARVLGRYDFMRRQPHQVWEVVASTKRNIADGANAHSQQNILVFHIVDFHRKRLELGARSCRQMTQRVFEHVERGLGQSALVSLQKSGTIIAILPGDRDSAERAAGQIVQAIDETPLLFNGHGGGASVKLACGMIAFSQAEQPLAQLIAEPPLIQAGSLTTA